MKRASLLVFLSFISLLSNGQGILSIPDTLNKQRAWVMGASEVVITTSTLAGLQLAWYQQYDQGRFRFFNDWEGWMQMDKVGHAVSSYEISSQLDRIHRWSGMKDATSRWLSAGLSMGYLTTVEVMDGFSSGWGFSAYDFLFNTAGVALFAGQDWAWNEQRFKLKFSFSPSGLDQMNDFGTNYLEVNRAESLYGTSVVEQWLKDYNGQTYWLNANIWSLSGKPEWMPEWVDVSLGYSVNGMLGAESNTWLIENENNPFLYTSSVQRQRQYLLSLDLNLDHVDLPRGLIWLRPLVHFIKLPFPALEWNDRSGFQFRPFYF